MLLQLLGREVFIIPSLLDITIRFHVSIVCINNHTKLKI